MRQLMAVIVSLCLITGASAQTAPSKGAPPEAGAEAAKVDTANKGDATAELTDPGEILRRADEALKRVTLVKYYGIFRGMGGMAMRFPSVRGTVILGGVSGDELDKYHLDVHVVPPRGTSRTKVLMSSNGHVHYFVDEKTKTVHVDTDPEVSGDMGRLAKFIALPHFTHANALWDELRMEKATLLGSAQAGGEDCYHLELQNAEGPLRARWWISRRDFLPRRRELAWRHEEEGPAGLLWDFVQLEVDPKLEEDAFKIAIPEGYTKTDQPAK
ncbi:MAG: DUF2092 domain-containing protein [Phycisphaerales bacterium]|nr:MAG: DUF2092 domain-containing protein [Phycisphaerales bacterium]